MKKTTVAKTTGGHVYDSVLLQKDARQTSEYNQLSKINDIVEKRSIGWKKKSQAEREQLKLAKLNLI
jgi:hypothetical protein